MRKNSNDLFVSLLEDVRNVYRWNKCIKILFFTFLPTMRR